MHRILVVLALCCLAPAAVARAEAPPADRSLSPYFFIEDGDPSTDRLPLQGTAVHVTVAGVIADVTVSQTYKNDGSRPINARYVFPGSTRAAVHGLTMRVGDEVVVAKIKKREEARKDFETAKEQGKNASLLEQDRPNVFSMSVANVMPGQTIVVALRYSELLVPTGGVYELVYPTVVGPRYASASESAVGSHNSAFVGSPYLRAGDADKISTLALTASIAAGVPVRDLRSPSHRILTTSAADHASVVLDPTEKKGGDRDFVLHYRLAGDTIASGVILEEGAGADGESFFLLMAQPPARVTPEVIPAREYVFILDVSGSMDGWPLDTAKDLMAELAVRLRPTDTFNVLLFAGDSLVFAPASIPASPANIEAAVHFVDAKRSGGGTELLPALRQALTMPHETQRARTFVVITDGYISAEKEAFEIVHDHLGEANVFTFGIGTSVNRFLIEGLARAGKGEPFIVEDSSKASEVAVRFRAYIESPVLTRVKLEAEGFEIYDVEPRSVPDVFADRPIIIHGKYRGPRTGKLRLTGVGGAGDYSATFDVATVIPSPSQALRQLWARTRIATLSDATFGSDDAATEKEVTDLGLKYSLLTRFTSFIAIREKIVNAGAPAANVDQPLALPQNVSEMAIPMESGDEPSLVAVFLALCAASALLVRNRRRRA